jgi:hypothetical protein
VKYTIRNGADVIACGKSSMLPEKNAFTDSLSQITIQTDTADDKIRNIFHRNGTCIFIATKPLPPR